MRKSLTIAATGLLALAGAAAAQDETAGRAEYMVACAGCHGESGMGDGPFAPLLNIEVPAVTGLAAANDGEFPFLETLMIIDGRTGVRGHGGSMPVWGDRFQETAEAVAGPYGSEVIARGRLLSLVYYLESIQQ